MLAIRSAHVRGPSATRRLNRRVPPGHVKEVIIIAMPATRVLNPALKSRIMSAADAAALIPPRSTVGMSGFTGSGYPKAVPTALAERMDAARAKGDPFKLKVWTGASTGPELDGALAKADGIEFRLPYNSDPIAREKINKGEMEYL